MTPQAVQRAVRRILAEHDCEPGQVRQRRCPHCTADGCAQLDRAQRAYDPRRQLRIRPQAEIAAEAAQILAALDAHHEQHGGER